MENIFSDSRNPTFRTDFPRNPHGKYSEKWHFWLGSHPKFSVQNPCGIRGKRFIIQLLLTTPSATIASRTKSTTMPPRKSPTKRKARVVSDSSIEILEPPLPPSPPKKKLASAKSTPAGTERPVYKAFPLSSGSIIAQLDAIFSESATTRATRPPSSRVRVKTEKAKLLANPLPPSGHINMPLPAIKSKKHTSTSEAQSDVTASPSTHLSKIVLTTPTTTPKRSRVSSARQTSPEPHARSWKLPMPVAGSDDSGSDDLSTYPLPSLFNVPAPNPERLSADMGSPTPSEESMSGAPVDVNAINGSEAGSDDGGESSWHSTSAGYPQIPAGRPVGILAGMPTHGSGSLAIEGWIRHS
ncbi:hypothetical protein BD779DRAFT_1468998 [Infundibulicybe gibba]|nr:hypothetical protein BD779DRAFT_1468998 [Infundibulicybe gibba]